LGGKAKLAFNNGKNIRYWYSFLEVRVLKISVYADKKCIFITYT